MVDDRKDRSPRAIGQGEGRDRRRGCTSPVSGWPVRICLCRHFWSKFHEDRRPFWSPATIVAVAASAGKVLAGSPALAWGDLGHEIVAMIAYRHLTPAARRWSIACSQATATTSPLHTSPAAPRGRTSTAIAIQRLRHGISWPSRSTSPTTASACSRVLPASPPHAASQGPAHDCVEDKIDDFVAERKDPATPPPERRLALRFVVHFVGELHQPLNAADHNDRDGNCIALSPSPDGGVTKACTPSGTRRW